jgi:hypothetical protein
VGETRKIQGQKIIMQSLTQCHSYQKLVMLKQFLAELTVDYKPLGSQLFSSW